METFIVIIIVVICVYLLQKLDTRYILKQLVSRDEGFENRPSALREESATLSYPPNGPAPTELYDEQPYHLLADMMQQPRLKEALSCVNSRSCYATDFGRMLEKTGTFRQMTNNYKRNYPDSCSGWQQELTLNFYKADPVPVPQNNTGDTVSMA
jgi:hypothetical protein